MTYIATAIGMGGGGGGGQALYGGVVDAGGAGDYTTIQAGDNDLDAGAYTMLVKSGTYAESPVIDTNNVRVVCEPGTTINGTLTLSGTDITFILGAGSSVQDDILPQGVNISVICRNGVTIGGITAGTGADQLFVDGGGWGSVSDDNVIDGYSGTGDDAIITNMMFDNRGGSERAAMSWFGSRSVFSGLKVRDADTIGLMMEQDFGAVIGCTVIDSDDQGIQANDSGVRVIGNIVILTNGTDGYIRGNSLGDNSLYVGNVSKGTPTFYLHSAADDSLVVGNRGIGGAVSDNTSTSTVASNDVT